MSLSQIQSRPSLANGVGRRQGDRDLGNRSENLKNEQQNHRPFRPSSSLTASTAVGQQHVNQTNCTFAGQSAIFKSSGDSKVEASAGGESRDGGQEPLNQHLLYLTACLIGQLVEVQVKNGSIYSGVFHTASAEKDYGVVLKIARLVRDGLSRGKSELMAKDSTKRPVKTLVIQAKDLVQINAKDVPVSGELLQNGRARENRAEIVTDSFLSQGRHGEVERELKPWTPDNDDFRDLGLDSTFQNTWNRNWDQFEINKTLFGVKSTFDEELYTTKLNRGPQLREREREAWRIAREIEAQSTKNLHVVEERTTDDFDVLDEESKFSSVLRSSDAEEIPENTSFNICNDETSNFSRQAATSSLGDTSPDNFGEAESRNFNKLDSTKSNDADSLSSSVDLITLSNDNFPVLSKGKLQNTAAGDSNKRVMKVGGLTSPAASIIVEDVTNIQALNLDPGCRQVTEDVYRDFNEFRQQENAKRGKKHREDQVNELKSFSESLKELTVKQQVTTIAGSNHKTAAVQTSPPFGLPASPSISTSLSTVIGRDASSLIASSRSLPSGSSEGLIRVLSNEVEPVTDFAQSEAPIKQSLAQHSSETASTSLISIPSTTTPSSPSSSSGVSTGADSFRRSTLNPNAKEFKLNPNAKAFTPSFTPLRPPSPVVQTPVYVPGVLPPIAPLPNMPVGVGVSSMMQSGGQSATKYTPYQPVAVAPSPGSNPYLPSPGTYTPGAGVTGTALSPALVGGQSAIKVPPQLQQSAVAAQAYGSQQPIRYTSQAQAVQPTSAYIHPSGHMYSQQMMFGQPGQVVYIQPYPQAASIPHPQPGQPSSQQPQPKHRSTGVQGVQLCVAPPFIAGQQHFLPQVQVPQLSNPLQSTPGVLVPTTMSAIQPPQGVIGGLVTPTQANAGASVVRVGGKFVGMNYQQ
ncbi:hypothetical protein GOP47_0024310 [Adiantum capillus-veneris]|uniref:LsmAD domain-containing protein n=1 Tax=Adiantum capillus-veneris TaxID=13818 RepID=A0A9D4Z3J1_ADICA|nr:hypothetical protein GOP47_0024310 [Adiantum capillus-veneris]